MQIHSVLFALAGSLTPTPPPLRTPLALNIN